MATEIERKFLLPNLDNFKPFDGTDPEDASKINEHWEVYCHPPGYHFGIRQGYLSFQPTVRVRIVNGSKPPIRDVEGGPYTKAYYTVKGPGLLSRQEFEYEIPVADAKEMMELCLGTIIKERFKWPYKGHVFEVDKFKGKHKGLVLVEVELGSEDEVFEMPDWLKGAKEVTEDPRYTNAWLSVKGGVPAQFDTPHDQHIARVQDYCRKIEEWAQACMTPLPTDTLHRHEWRRKFYEHYQFMWTAVKKSDCLSRLLYNDEELRTVQCPIHKGSWSGLHIEPCPEGCDYTGWLPNK